MTEEHQSGVTVEGGCLCGALRWRAGGTPLRITNHA
jgi:hypothetical protein